MFKHKPVIPPDFLIILHGIMSVVSLWYAFVLPLVLPFTNIPNQSQPCRMMLSWPIHLSLQGSGKCVKFSAGYIFITPFSISALTAGLKNTNS